MHTTKALAILTFAATMAAASPVGRAEVDKEHLDVPNYANFYLDKKGEETKADVPNYANSYLDKKGKETEFDVPNYANSYLD
ncbi:hypothetical protein GGR55DRAFT_681283 [Xylaria sp. FL0064]|nr:hypothetical protein GGR55DRAFT_681283 [Xylaria sp. FL0064]